MKNKKSIITYVIFIVGIVILLNLLSSRYFARLDFTADKRFTLSHATKDIVHGLEDPVTVTAYFTDDLPAAIKQTKLEFKDLLTEYSNISKGKVVFEFVDPSEDEKIEQEIAQKGIQPRIINVREKDQAVQKKVYLSAIVKFGEKEEIIPFILTGAAMEYDLSTAIKKLTLDNKPVIGFIQGHGEPSIDMMGQALKSLNVLYNVESVNLTDSTLLDKYETLALIAPTDSIPENHFYYLDEYLANGGNLYVAINRVDGNLQTAQGTEITTGLESWLEEKGVKVEGKFLVDASCGQVTVQQKQGFFTFNSQKEFPYLPRISTFTEHPASSGIETVIMQFASPLTFVGDTTLKFKALALSSESCGTLNAPLYFDIQRKWGKSDFPLSNLPVAASIEGKIEGNTNSKMVVIGDGDFAINGQGQQAHAINPDNVNLMVNSIDWLSDDTGLIELRTKGITSRPLDQIEDGKKTFLKYLNFLLPILLILIYGFIRNERNRTRRLKRMQDNYIY